MADTYGISKEQLTQFIERIERLEEEKGNIAQDISDVLKEAKGNGFDVKAMRRIIKARKLTPEQRMEQAELARIYAEAIGMGGDV